MTTYPFGEVENPDLAGAEVYVENIQDPQFGDRPVNPGSWYILHPGTDQETVVHERTPRSYWGSLLTSAMLRDTPGWRYVRTVEASPA